MRLSIGLNVLIKDVEEPTECSLILGHWIVQDSMDYHPSPTSLNLNWQILHHPSRKENISLNWGCGTITDGWRWNATYSFSIVPFDREMIDRSSRRNHHNISPSALDDLRHHSSRMFPKHQSLNLLDNKSMTVLDRLCTIWRLINCSTGAKTLS